MEVREVQKMRCSFQLLELDARTSAHIKTNKNQTKTNGEQSCTRDGFVCKIVL